MSFGDFGIVRGTLAKGTFQNDIDANTKGLIHDYGRSGCRKWQYVCIPRDGRLCMTNCFFVVHN